MIQVHITDDHKMLVEGLLSAINESGVAQVVGTSYTLEECRKALAFDLPDVLLLDISMPDGNGIDFCAEIHAKYPSMKVLMLTSYDEFTIVNRAIAAGASGYILKSAVSKEVLEGIQATVAGEIYFSKEIDRLMKKRIDSTVWLTAREQELLRHIVDGYTNQEIAEKMFLSIETVKTYRKNLVQKLGTKNVADLVHIAMRDKWV